MILYWVKIVTALKVSVPSGCWLVTALSSLSCSFLCHGSLLFHSQQKALGRGGGDKQEWGRNREKETAIRWKLQSCVITEVTSQHVGHILLVRSKVPVPPTLKSRWLYKGVTIRKWGPLGAIFVSLSQHTWPVGCLSDALFCLHLAFFVVVELQSSESSLSEQVSVVSV